MLQIFVFAFGTVVWAENFEAIDNSSNPPRSEDISTEDINLLQAQILFRDALREINTYGVQTPSVRKLQLALGMSLPHFDHSFEAKFLVPKIYSALAIVYAKRGQFIRARITLRDGMAYARKAQDQEDLRVLEGGLNRIDHLEKEFEPVPPGAPLLLPNDPTFNDPIEIRQMIELNPDRYELFLSLAVALIGDRSSTEEALEAAKRVDALAPPTIDPGLYYDLSFDEVFAMALLSTAVQRAENRQAGLEEIRMLQRSLGMGEAFHREDGLLDNLYAWLAALQLSVGRNQAAEYSALIGLKEAELSGDEKMIKSVQQILNRIRSNPHEKNQGESNDADNPVNSPENPNNHTDD